MGACLDAVRQAGFQLASAGEADRDVRRRLEAPLMSTEDYVRFLALSGNRDLVKPGETV